MTGRALAGKVVFVATSEVLVRILTERLHDSHSNSEHRVPFSTVNFASRSHYLAWNTYQLLRFRS